MDRGDSATEMNFCPRQSCGKKKKEKQIHLPVTGIGTALFVKNHQIMRKTTKIIKKLCTGNPEVVKE